jgi:hypothetical protein
VNDVSAKKKFKFKSENLAMNLLHNLSNDTNKFPAKEYQEIFEFVDDIIFNSSYRRENWISKGFYWRTIIFANGYVRFKRRKHIMKESSKKFNPDKAKTCFMFDVLVGIEKYQRLDLGLQYEIISMLGGPHGCKDIINIYKKIGLTKQIIFNLIKNFDVKGLAERLMIPPDKTLDHNGFIYIEIDDGFVNALTGKKLSKKQEEKKLRKGWTKNIRSKCITLAVTHTGIETFGKRNVVQNKLVFTTVNNEDTKINNKKFWKTFYEFIKINYSNAEQAKIVVLGDGASKIKICEKYIPSIFVIDRFHPLNMVGNSLRGNKAWKQEWISKMHAAIYKMDFDLFYQHWCDVLATVGHDEHKIDLLMRLLKFMKRNWKHISLWREKWYPGCRIEAYMSHIIKVMFRARPKIFNEITIQKVFLLKQLVSNGIDIFAELRFDKEEELAARSLRYRQYYFNDIESVDVHVGAIPALAEKNSTLKYKLLRYTR